MGAPAGAGEGMADMVDPFRVAEKRVHLGYHAGQIPGTYCHTVDASGCEWHPPRHGFIETRRGLLMFRTLGAAALLAVASVMPVQQAAAQDPIAGGIFGGAVGGIIGGALGGRG